VFVFRQDDCAAKAAYLYMPACMHAWIYPT
jgi:hypothetical protein